ncbi:Chromosome partitioning protein parA (modular protein) [Microbacterium sp. C448]|nr:AAA family ATPase [Microbacterium sp. C448]CDJ99962.1 Chromosome partitioning protein parA (modular protein) [Microbacterium sp. C448]
MGSREEFRVLLWDLDPQGAATFLLQVKPKVKGGVAALVAGDSKVSGAIRSTAYDNLDVLPGNASYRDLDLVLDHAKKSEQRVAKILEQVERDYDVVILDCPPGASLVAENAVFSADAVVVPLVPSPLSMRCLDQVVEFVGASVSKARIVGFLSMVDRRKTLHRTTVEQLPQAQKAVTNVVVPATVHVERMGTERAPIGSFAPGVEAAQAYGELWALIGERSSRRRAARRAERDAAYIEQRGPDGARARRRPSHLRPHGVAIRRRVHRPAGCARCRKSPTPPRAHLRR